ncbi:MAG: type II secretion system F family protein [Candidatus Sungbacteria bacterium]|nr:type II secretion system F family protein [bacterium]MDZ4260619.1 type II secretion system F family protein [Candidatus Sungbacteria bacterium]
MPLFKYSAAKQDGTLATGEREAENDKALAVILKQEGLLLLRAEAPDKKKSFFKFNVGELISRIRPVSLVERMFFARNLAVMIKAGLPLTRALEASSEESANPKFKKVLAEVLAEVIKGKTFADALRSHPNVFNELYVNMVAVGEESGKLALVLRLLSKQMKKDHDLRSRVRGAMIYPAIIICAIFGIGGLMMVYVIPTLAETIKSLGTELPWSTKLIIGLSDFLQYNGFLALGIIAGTVFTVWRVLKTKKGRDVFGRLILKAPIFGAIVQKFNLAQFTRTLAYLIASGIPIVRSLEITARVLGNVKYRAAVEEASREIQKGKQLNEILHRNPDIFHPMVVQMIKVGEESGKISDMLLRLAMYFEEDVENTTKNLSTIIEPVLMLMIGAFVGFFAISILQPIYGSLNNI